MDGMGTPGEGLGRCSHALIRGVPESLASGEGAGAGFPALDLAKAQREHGVLGGKLRQRLGLQLLELPPEESLPLGPLLGDTAVIQGDTALITRPWSPSRRPEVSAAARFGGLGVRRSWTCGALRVMVGNVSAPRPLSCSKVDGVRKALQDLGLRIVEMGDENATLDGTDVLFTGEAEVPASLGFALGSRAGETRPCWALFPTHSGSQTSAASLGSGREFFVGLSKWTNHRGAEIVADTFRVRSGTSFLLGKRGADGVGGVHGGGAE